MALYANQVFGQAIRRELLLSTCRSQVSEMLDDRRLAALEVRKASLDLKRALHLGNIGAAARDEGRSGSGTLTMCSSSLAQ